MKRPSVVQGGGPDSCPATGIVRPVHGAAIDRACREYGGVPSDWIDVSNSINPRGLPRDLLESLAIEASRRLDRYPDPEYLEARDGLARTIGIDPSHVWPLNGSVEGIHAVARIRAGAPVLAPAPSFAEYRHAASIVGSRVEEPDLRRAGTPSPDDIPEGGLVFIANPNSPTGTSRSREEILFIVAVARERDTIVAVDEVFLPFARDPAALSVADGVADHPNLVVLRSVTKSHGLPGLRLGLAVAAPSLIEELRTVIEPWSVNPLAGLIAARLPEWEAMIADQIARLMEEGVTFTEELAAIPAIEVDPTDANFVLARIRVAGIDARVLRDRMARERILIRSCGDYPFLDESHFRLAFRTAAENQKVVAALRRALAA